MKTPKTDNRSAAQFLKGGSHRRERRIVTPEGVPLTVEIAEYSERVSAFLMDVLIWGGMTFVLYLPLIAIVTVYGLNFLESLAAKLILSIVWFIAFLVRMAYFAHFELAWQGSTPGKRMVGLRVVDRGGGPLTPSSVIARNLTREFETFIPLGVLFSLGGGDGWASLLSVIWILALAALPLLNRDRMRGGDLIAGTIVVALPRHALLDDIAQSAEGDFHYAFTDRHLAAYGAFELQVLEEVLRRNNGAADLPMLGNVGEKIRRKIGWTDPVDDELLFLKDFYTAQRAFLERQQLFGKVRADKNHEARPRAV
jgi:uncharacterized RDD family membrane protein YckC